MTSLILRSYAPPLTSSSSVGLFRLVSLPARVPLFACTKTRDSFERVDRSRRRRVKLREERPACSQQRVCGAEQATKLEPFKQCTIGSTTIPAEAFSRVRALHDVLPQEWTKDRRVK